MIKEKRSQPILSWCQGRSTKVAATYREKNSLGKAGNWHSCDFENTNSEKSWAGHTLPVWRPGQEDLSQSYPDPKGVGVAWPRQGCPVSQVRQGASDWLGESEESVQRRGLLRELKEKKVRRCWEEAAGAKTEGAKGHLQIGVSNLRKWRTCHKVMTPHVGRSGAEMENLRWYPSFWNFFLLKFKSHSTYGTVHFQECHGV